MPSLGRTAHGVGVVLALISLSLQSFSDSAEFRVFKTHVSLAGEDDDPRRGTDYYLSGGAEDGLRVGQRLEVYRDEVVPDPSTREVHTVRLPVGEVVIVSVAATAAVARPVRLVSRDRAPMLRHHAVMVGDVAIPVAEHVSDASSGVPAETAGTSPFDISLPLDLPSSILFDLDSAKLRPVEDVFSRVEEAIRELPNHHVIVEGHTCDLGTRPHNEKLALARAHAVARYLTDRYGVTEERMTVVGYGPDRPADRSMEGRARNRRVELLFTTRP